MLPATKRPYWEVGIHVVLPIVLGSLIYVLWRDRSLWVFDWLDALGLTDLTMKLRLAAQPVTAWLPHCVLYCLPDGLWVYALVASMAQIWREQKGVVCFAWLATGPVLGCGGELGQLTGLVPGTFDYTDLMLCLTGAVLPFVTVRNRSGSS